MSFDHRSHEFCFSLYLPNFSCLVFLPKVTTTWPSGVNPKALAGDTLSSVVFRARGRTVAVHFGFAVQLRGAYQSPLPSVAEIQMRSPMAANSWNFVTPGGGVTGTQVPE